jgi:hypothetical protein
LSPNIAWLRSTLVVTQRKRSFLIDNIVGIEISYIHLHINNSLLLFTLACFANDFCLYNINICSLASERSRREKHFQCENVKWSKRLECTTYWALDRRSLGTAAAPLGSRVKANEIKRRLKVMLPHPVFSADLCITGNSWGVYIGCQCYKWSLALKS